MTSMPHALVKIAPAIFDGTPVLFAYLYGSYATGLATPFSDLDVGVFVEDLDAIVDTIGCLKLELSLSLLIDQQLDHVVQSEVRTINHLPLVVKGSIVTEGKLIYCRDEDQRITFETEVRKEYFDFLPAMKQYNRAYIQGVMSR